MLVPDLRLVQNTADLITKELELSSDVFVGADSFEQLREQVAKVVEWYMEKNFGQLLNLLYIMDVDEEKVKKAVAGAEIEESVAHLFADIIIERELKKVESRIKYKQTYVEEDEAEKW